MTSPKQQAATVLLVDDHPLMRKGLRTLLDAETDLTVVGEASDGQKALDQVKALAPDIVVMDISMPNLNGIEATRRILADAPGTRVIALSIHAEKRFVDDMLKAGAAAYVIKDSVPEELVNAIHAVLRGEAFLSAPILGTVVSGYRKAVDESAVATPILQTKLHRPALPRDLVPRTKLLERIEAGRTRPLTLVSAPAGYGKSVLISSWLERCDWPSAWFSLDEDDSDLRQFLIYIVSAIRTIYPQACEHSLSLCSVPELPAMATLATTLINELDALDQPFILVIDDYHRIHVTSAVNDLLYQLLSRPPIPLHLVILSRRDPPLPLVTLRAIGQLTEIRMQDLRFSTLEVRSLLEKSAGFTIGDEMLANLENEMEGWVAGLQLLMLVSRRLNNPEELLTHLHGGVQQTQEYLVQEVINHQPPRLRDWLLKSAILDRICVPLCDAVCAEGNDAETSPMTAVEFVAALRENNLFIIPLDTQGEWFRYHHLFQALLQSELSHRLPADEITALHARASAWFESQHMHDEAIQYALKVKDADGAADIVERQGYRELEQDRWFVLKRWLARLPASVIQQRPGVLMGQVWVAFFQQQFSQIESNLDDIELRFNDEAANGDLLGEVSFFRGYLLYWAGDSEQSQHRLEKALTQVSPAKGLIRGEIELQLSLARHMSGEGDLAIRALNDHIKNPGEPGSRFLSRLVCGLSFIHLLSGDLLEAKLAARRMLALASKSRTQLSDSWGFYLQACANLHGLHLEDALRCFIAGTEDPYGIDARAAVDAFAGLALTQQLMNQADAATRTIKRLMNFVKDTNDPVHLAIARSCEARCCLLRGDLKPAIKWAQSFGETAGLSDLFMWLEVPAITRTRVLIASGSTKHLSEASESLREIRHLSETCRFTKHEIEVAVLQCMVLEKQGHSDAALEGLQKALDLAEPGEWICPFVELGQPMAELFGRLAGQNNLTEFARGIVAEFPKIQAQPGSTVAGKPLPGAASMAWSGEPLTSRELDILALVADRLQNKEIASRLFVSPETVKTHLKHLYQKLGVSNRRDAAAKAVEILAKTRLS